MIKEKFLYGFGNWDNYKPFLWQALEMAKESASPVLELGAGMGSTDLLRRYCEENKLKFFTYESNSQYAKDFNSFHVENWDLIPWRKDWGVVLVDHAPGEHRKTAVSLLHHAKIVVCHDSEPHDHGYLLRAELEKYKYMVDMKTPGAWTTAVSNFYDVTKFTL